MKTSRKEIDRVIDTMKLILLQALLALLATHTSCFEPNINLFDSVVKQIKTGYVDIAIGDNKIILSIRKNDGVKFEGSLYTKNPAIKNSGPLTIKKDCEKSTTCVLQAGKTIAKIKADPEDEVVHVSRVVDNKQGEVDDCFELTDDMEWYGGPEWRYQHWPIQHMYFEEETYLTSHPQNAGFAERYWLSSQGISIYVNEKDPLFLDQNNLKAKHMCLVAKNKKPYLERKQVTLNYEIGIFRNPRIARTAAVGKYFGKPTGHPDEKMVTHPIWSTWARYKVDIDDKSIREFADEIIKNGFKNSQLEIDDGWEPCYGSATFNTKKFPDAAKLLSDLKKKGFRVTIWIHPFINEGCNSGEAYDYALKNGYFVKNATGGVHTSWWQGVDAAVIDFTNLKAVQWWVGRLKKLEKLGIDGFKFDAGEVDYLPQDGPQLNAPLELIPSTFTLNYTSALAKNSNDMIEVRSGWRGQTLPIFTRMLDKDSRWTWSNGLPTLIPTLLQMNLNGYNFVLPDMIGGNGYINGGINTTELPPKELFIRWLQINTFMPSMQYSFVPWDYDSETVKIGRTFSDLHAQYAPKIIELMKETVKTGAIINPPIWWVDIADVTAHKINDEYLLGEDILVAPVIEEGATSRDIYLPNGQWKDAKTGKVYRGAQWILDYPAPLDVLPHFLRVK